MKRLIPSSANSSSDGGEKEGVEEELEWKNRNVKSEEKEKSCWIKAFEWSILTINQGVSNMRHLDQNRSAWGFNPARLMNFKN